MKRGMFFSLDGVDGAGKTTQCRLLADHLRTAGHQVVLCRDPGGTPVGDRIREILLDRSSHMSQICEAILYMASRAELVASVIRPALERGCIVLSDRYLLANVVYQGHAGEIAPETLWEIGRVATAGILPDLTLVLDLPPEVAQARKDGLRDRLEARGLDFARRVREGFLSEARRDPDRIRVIDAARPADEVQKELQQEVAHVLGSRAGT